MTIKTTMRSIVRTAAFLMLALALCGGVARASYQTYTFGDTHENWDGYPAAGYPMHDENGVPLFPSEDAGGVTVDDTHNTLRSISINYKWVQSGLSLATLLKPGDLFLDVDGDTGWDYVVRSSVALNDEYSSVGGVLVGEKRIGGVLAAGEWVVYAFDDEVLLSDTGKYTLAHDTTERDGDAWDFTHVILRGYHPWALNENWLQDQIEAETAHAVGTVSFSGWQDPLNKNSVGLSLFDFTNNTFFSTLEMDKVVFSFTVNCANDVLIESIPLDEPTGDPVPEPASLLIWGLLGLSFAGGSWRLAFRRRWTDWDEE